MYQPFKVLPQVQTQGGVFGGVLPRVDGGHQVHFSLWINSKTTGRFYQPFLRLGLPQIIIAQSVQAVREPILVEQTACQHRVDDPAIHLKTGGP